MALKLDKEFINLIYRHLGIIHKVSIIYTNNADDKEDLMQEMMYQLWKSYPAFDNRSKFSTWMYRVCLNTALTFRKKQRKYEVVPISEQHFQIREDNSDKDEGIRDLMDAIKNLKPLNKAIILLYLEELSYADIADITGLSKSNVSVRLVRIKKELEKNLKQKLSN